MKPIVEFTPSYATSEAVAKNKFVLFFLKIYFQRLKIFFHINVDFRGDYSLLQKASERFIWSVVVGFVSSLFLNTLWGRVTP